MCGIAACISKKGTVDRDRFDAMTDIVRHRGPDDRGVYFDKNVALGHRRLSIIDLSANGHQPFVGVDGFVLVFNGEIYNYLELREELINCGHRFISHTDTEIIIHAYKEWGDDCVMRFNGMWAFALYDVANGRFFCSRDRYGVKPFYYTDQEGLFLIASEIKQFFEMLDDKPSVNKDSLMRYIVRGETDGPPYTLYENIFQLSPGYNLIYDLKTNEYRAEKYYDLSIPENKNLSYEEACRLFRDSFIDSVKLRLRSDVPVGYFLSGGLDSSSIVCVADRLHKESSDTEYDQHTISSCYKDKKYDEQEYIDEVVNNTDVIVHKVFPEDNVWDRLDKIIWHMDEPVFGASGLSQWSVCEAAGKQGLKVILDGQGSDEQLAGYSDFYTVLFIDLLKRLKISRFRKEIKAYATLKQEDNHSASYKNTILSAIKDCITPEKTDAFVKKIYYKHVAKLPFDSDALKKVFKDLSVYPRRHPRRFIKAYMAGELVNILHNLDRKTMAFSIEARDPFLDYRLIEDIYQMPFEYKIKDGWTKSVLRDGLAGIIPEKIQKRKTKLAFVAPIENWVNGDRDKYRTELVNSLDKLESLFDKSRVLKWYDNKNHLSTGECNLVWRIIVSGRWIGVFDIKI